MTYKVLGPLPGQEADPAVVWVALGGHPAYEYKAEFRLSPDGDLIILDRVGNFYGLDPEHYEAVPT